MERSTARPRRGVAPRRLLLVAAALVPAAFAGPLLWPGASVMAPGDGRLTHRYSNPAGGYEVRHPAGWSMAEEGTAATLTAPGEDVVISFGLGGGGSPASALRRLTASILGTYADVELHGVEALSLPSHPALAVSGTGANEAGARIRFLAATVATPRRNHSITVFTAADSDPRHVLPTVNAIVGSFRPLGAPSEGRSRGRGPSAPAAIPTTW